jgi:phosphonate degradation associated HDIG domain protein
MTAVDDVLALFARWGGARYDEEVTQTDHAIQCAALAVRDGADDALVAAALLHDVGHLLHLADGGAYEPGVDRRHEVGGADHLARDFPAAVTEPIRWHVEAKRYLCAVEPEYAAGLSAGSRRSLVVQGGPMTADEAAVFVARPGAADAVRLRRWDDAGKVVGLERPAVETYREMLERLTRG